MKRSNLLILLIALFSCSTEVPSKLENYLENGKEISEETTSADAGSFHGKWDRDYCDAGSAAIRFTFYDDSGSEPVTKKQWACDAYSGTVTDIPAGSDISVSFTGLDASGRVIMRGEMPHVTITANQTTTVEKIEMTFLCQAPKLDEIEPQQGYEGEHLSFSVSATDPDSDGGLEYSASNVPTEKGASFSGQTFNWTPKAGDADDYVVTFKVCDKCEEGPLCDVETVTITVTETPPEPVYYYVAPLSLGNNENDGLSPSSPFATIQHAVNTAPAGTQQRPVIIRVAAGLYTENIMIDKCLSLEGGWNTDFSIRYEFDRYGIETGDMFKTVIDGGFEPSNEDYESDGPCITIELDDSALFIDGFTIQKGNGDGAHPGPMVGGIYNNSSTLHLLNCVITDQYGPSLTNNSNRLAVISNCSFRHNFMGPAIYNCDFSSAEIKNCTITRNFNYYTAGIYNGPNSTTNISLSAFIDNNSEGKGAAIYNGPRSISTIFGCDFMGNMTTAGGSGGAAIYNDQGSLPKIINCLFSDNRVIEPFDSGINGGAIYNNSSSPLIVNSVFSGNYVYGCGGAIYNISSAPGIINCTFYSNRAILGEYDGALGGEGGAIYNTNSTPTITNSIFWANNASVNGNQIFNFADSYSRTTYCNIDQDGFETSSGNIRVPPQFEDAYDENFHLLPNSPCIDAGTNNVGGLPDTDIENAIRISDGDNDGMPIVDMGAYETVISN